MSLKADLSAAKEKLNEFPETDTIHNQMIQDILKSAKEQIEAMKEEVNKTKEQFAITEVGKDGKVVVDAQDPQEVIKAKAAKWAAENKSK